MLDYFKHEKNFTDPSNIVDKVDIRGHVIAECDAALKIMTVSNYLQEKVKHHIRHCY